MSRRFIKSVTLSVLAFLVSSSAHGAPLSSGAITAVAEPTPVGSIVGQESTQFTGGLGATASSGTLTTTVYKNDTQNHLGGLTFTFLIQNASSPTSQTSITSMSSVDFTGFSTDVGFDSSTSGVQPATVSRNTPDVIGWTYTAQNGVIAPGSSGKLLIIQTNAPSFNNSIASFLGGQTVSTAGTFGPVVPEPAMISLLGMATLLLAHRRR